MMSVGGVFTSLKLAFYGADTDFLADILARMSVSASWDSSFS